MFIFLREESTGFQSKVKETILRAIIPEVSVISVVSGGIFLCENVYDLSL